MIEIYKNIKNIDEEQWNKLVKNSEVSTFFQTKKCYDFYATLSFLDPFLIAVSENKTLVGLICGYIITDGKSLKKYFSRRAIVPGGVLLDSNISDKSLALLLNSTLKELSKRAIYVEIRNYCNFENYKKVFESCKFKYQQHLNFHVSTPDLNTTLKQLSSSKRRDIKISKKSNAEWYESHSISELRDFYIIITDLYANKIRRPLFPFEFFEKLIQGSYGKFFVVKFNQKVIGGSICVCLPESTIFEWFVCGIDGLYKNIYPSTLATWAAIEYAANNNYARFDMMGAGKPNEDYGVRDFKARFGGDLVENGRFLKVNNIILYFIGTVYVKIRRNFKF